MYYLGDWRAARSFKGNSYIGLVIRHALVMRLNPNSFTTLSLLA